MAGTAVVLPTAPCPLPTLVTPLLVGLDIGTTNVKAVVYEPDGRAVARATATTITHHPRPGWAYSRAEEIWEQAAGVLRAALAGVDEPWRVAGIAVASMAEAGVPLDAAGEATADVIAWFDTRPRAQTAWLEAAIGGDALFARTGLSLQPIFGLCKMLWLKEHEPDAWRRTVRWLNVSDYVAFRLSGVPATGASLASRTMALDLRRRRWDDGILRAAGIAPDLLAPLLPEGSDLGPVTPEAAFATGLPTTARVAVGGHDHLCGALAAGVTEPGTLLESLGTTDTMLLPVAAPLADPELGRQGYSQGAHVVPGRYYLFGGQFTLGAAIEWFRRAIAPGEPYEALIAAATTVPAGSDGVCFLPHLRLANPPYVDPASRGAFLGLTADATRATLFRALLEGLGFEARGVLEPLLAFAGVDALRDASAIGGVTQNRLLMEIRATIRGRAASVLEIDEATALGAALLGGLAAGVYPDVPTAVASLRYGRSAIAPVVANAPLYDAIYRDVYARLYPSLAPISHAIGERQIALRRAPSYPAVERPAEGSARRSS
jgi:xylulokinase